MRCGKNQSACHCPDAKVLCDRLEQLEDRVSFLELELAKTSKVPKHGSKEHLAVYVRQARDREKRLAAEAAEAQAQVDAILSRK
jgi:hypothetical protein